MLPDYPCSETERAGWLFYRQVLRDVPQQSGYPEKIVWPDAPKREKTDHAAKRTRDSEKIN